jgi:hypothetical protein
MAGPHETLGSPWIPLPVRAWAAPTVDGRQERVVTVLVSSITHLILESASRTESRVSFRSENEYSEIFEEGSLHDQADDITK